jgi:hypothetical protein
MKRILLASMCLFALSAQAQTSPGVTFDPLPQGITVDGRAVGEPPYIYVQNVPLGSGVPQVGATVGFSRADYVRDGLYHVPGYLPYTPSADTPAQVIQLRCKRVLDHSTREGDPPLAYTWMCDGYSINPQIGRGENILIQPILAK